MTQEDYRVIAEINLDAIAHNINQIKKQLSHNTEIMAIIKADAYGHGAIEVSKVLIENGVERLGVAILDEGKQLRNKGINVPILILGYTSPSKADEIVSFNLTQTVFTYEMAKALSDSAKAQNKNVNIHIKIDTGMGRIGFKPNNESINLIKEINKLPNLNIEGIFTHFSSADEADSSFTELQFNRFTSFIKELEKEKIYIPIKHCSNSAGFISYKKTHMNLIRPGIILYGLYPSDEVKKDIVDLKPAMTLKAKVIFVKEVEKNSPISYNRKFITKRKTKVATIPVGYADGYSRRLSSKGRVLIKGHYAPIIGNICMDQFMVDVTHIPNVKIGDEVILMGQQEDKIITAEEIAKKIGTINYEIICVVGKRIPRVYKKNKEIIKEINYIN
ncbi:alanine racemase [Defluviitalea phaphyphila]|uniref:alanine racemase n=1 Tax=Defluviitalea phaphyphila TaxID=1473580 RepID=UPI00073086DF|nr:alanine racemase [Defluviitalea phaphyphila]